MTDRTLYIVTCGAPLASRVGDGVREARRGGWNPYVIPTDAALPRLEDQDLSGAPIITGNRKPGESKWTPKADAVAVVPLTFNSLNAWANGNATTYPLTTLSAALGSRTPTVASGTGGTVAAVFRWDWVLDRIGLSCLKTSVTNLYQDIGDASGALGGDTSSARRARHVLPDLAMSGRVTSARPDGRNLVSGLPRGGNGS